MNVPERMQAFDDLVTRERPRVVAIAQRILGDRSAAEDVAQDVFVAFARIPGDARADEGMAGRLHVTAVRRAYNALRTEQRRREREMREHRLQGDARAARAHAADPALVLERAEDRARIRTALARIGDKHAAVLALRYGGLRYAEIASALGIGITSVGTRLARAESALAHELRDAVYEEL